VLHTFAGEPTDGENPQTGLVFDTSGDLFGVTGEGGANGDGTVYELTPDGPVWKESLLYSFMDSANDGGFPTGDKLAIDANGDLFGTAAEGGANNEGTIFELQNSAGSYTFLLRYSFCELTNCADGSFPDGGVILDASDNLYGTTVFGGTAEAGTAYKFTLPAVGDKN